MDAGLVEYLRTFGIQLVSSADLMQHFGAVLTAEQIETHRQAGEIIHRILDGTFGWIRENLDQGRYIDEWDMLQEMERLIAQEPIYMNTPPFFGVDDHASDPGYEPKPQGSRQIREGSRLIIDIAGRLPQNAKQIDMRRKTPCLVANQARCFYTLLDLTLTIQQREAKKDFHCHYTWQYCDRQVEQFCAMLAW